MSDDGYGGGRSERTSTGRTDSNSLLDRIFEGVSNKRRRYILYCLREQDQATVDDLAKRVTSWEQDVPHDKVPESKYQRVQQVLVHNHLPKLKEGGLIDYDHRSKTASYSDPPSLLEEVLRLAAPKEKPE